MKKYYVPATGLIIAIAIVGYLLNYALQVFFARHLTPVVYGDLSIALSTLAIATAAILMGTDSSSKRFLSTFINKNELENQKNWFTWNFSLLRKSF